MRLFILISALVTLFSCSPAVNETEGDLFYLNLGDAVLPVWIKGNTNSGKYLFVLHGGPGSTAMQYGELPCFKAIESNMAVVYFDQRLSGNSQGTADFSTFNFEQLCLDIDAVIDAVQLKAGNGKVFLLGHSWGGCLGTYYMLHDTNNGRVDAWIEMAGGHNWSQSAVQMSILHVTNYAQARLADASVPSADKSEWSNMIAWYADKTNVSVDYATLQKHTDYVIKAHGYVYDFDAEASNAAAVIHAPFRNGMVELMNAVQFMMRVPVSLGGDYKAWNTDLTPMMGQIRVPSMVLWGLHDGILPVPLAYSAYSNLGADATNKFLYIFSNSAHTIITEEPDQLALRVMEFVNRY